MQSLLRHLDSVFPVLTLCLLLVISPSRKVPEPRTLSPSSPSWEGVYVHVYRVYVYIYTCICIYVGVVAEERLRVRHRVNVVNQIELKERKCQMRSCSLSSPSSPFVQHNMESPCFVELPPPFSPKKASALSSHRACGVCACACDVLGGMCCMMSTEIT